MKRQEEINEIRSMLNELRGDSQQNFQYAKDDIIEYLSLSPQLTGLDYEIYIDDGYSYINHNHPIWLYVVGDNGNIVTITVEDAPRVIHGNINELTNVDEIFGFIEEYKEELIDIAEDKISSNDLFKHLKYK